MENNTDWEIVELFRNEETSRVFIHLRNPLNDLIKSYELVDLPEDHSTSYRSRCPDCDGPATHPSGLCRDCHQAILELEVEKIASRMKTDLDSEEATRREFSRRY